MLATQGWITPSEFMMYATPLVLLIAQEVRAIVARRDLQRMTEQQTYTLNDASQRRAEELKSATIDTASKLAIHTADKANQIGDELEAIHTIVNGNSTALRARIMELENEIAHRDAQALMDAQTAALNLAGDQRSTRVQSTVVDTSAALKEQIHDLEAQIQPAKQKP